MNILIIFQGQRSDFQNGARIVEVEISMLALAGTLHSCVPLRSWNYFENVIVNRKFHPVQHLTACLPGMCFTINRMTKKVEGHAPPI